MKSVHWFSLLIGIILGGSGGGLAAVANAESGDLLYEHSPDAVCITAAQAACFADCAIAAGTWDGDRTDMIHTQAHRTPSCESGFMGKTTGIKSAAPGNLPTSANGVKVLGIVE